MSTEELSPEDKAFLAECEEEFKDRYTEKDEEFMKIHNSKPSTPPIMESWFVHSGRRNDRRFNRSYHPYERHNRYGRGRYNDDYHRGQRYGSNRDRY